MAEQARFLETLESILHDWDELGNGSVTFRQFEAYLLDERTQVRGSKVWPNSNLQQMKHVELATS